MKWIFKKKASPENGARQEIKLLKNFRIYSERQQVKWAEWMGRKTSGFSKPILTGLLCLFVLTTSFYSGYLVLHGFTVTGSKIEVANIDKPKHFDKTGEPAQSPSQRTLITEEEYQKIRKFNRQMDSLSKSAEGKKQYQQIIRSRPGLLDSLKRIESLYEQLNK